MRIAVALVTLIGVLSLPSAAQAAGILFSGSGTGTDGITLNASALFEVTGSTLKVTLRNTGDTSGSLKDKSANTLTGVFFSLPTGISLSTTGATATIDPANLLQASTCDACPNPTTNVGGEFAYKSGSFSGHLGNMGIASSGYIGVSSGNMGGPDLDAPTAPNGINFGIVAPISLSNPFKPNSGEMSNSPLIEEEVVFTMAISGGTLLESDISKVSFQYGTGLSEPKFKATSIVVVPNPVGVPEPALSLLLVPGIAAWGLRRRHRAARTS